MKAMMVLTPFESLIAIQLPYRSNNYLVQFRVNRTFQFGFRSTEFAIRI